MAGFALVTFENFSVRYVLSRILRRYEQLYCMQMASSVTGEIVKCKLLFFAKASELVGDRESYICFNNPATLTGDEIKADLIRAFPQLNPIANSCFIALNQEYLELSDRVTLKDNDEIAVIPPISGG